MRSCWSPRWPRCRWRWPSSLSRPRRHPAPPAGSGETALATEPIVAQATAADRGKRRKVLGSPKNPFGVADDATGSAEPPDSDGSTTAQEPAPAQTGGAAPVAAARRPSSSPPPSSGGGAPVSPAPTTPAVPKPEPKQYDMYDLTVRFGDSTAGTERKTLKRLQPLPSAEAPVLIYLGVMRDGKTAVFLVDHGISAVGDGDCTPTPETCETILLRAGDTEFLDVKDADGRGHRAVPARPDQDPQEHHRVSGACAGQLEVGPAPAQGARVQRGPDRLPLGRRRGRAQAREPAAARAATVVAATAGLR